MQPPFARRLPSLPSVAALSEEHAAALSAANPCRVLLTATSRYRNDPYRASVIAPPPPPVAPDASAYIGESAPYSYYPDPTTGSPPPELQQTAGLHEKLAVGPRRGHLPMRSSLPALNATGGRGRSRRTPTPPPVPQHQQHQQHQHHQQQHVQQRPAAVAAAESAVPAHTIPKGASKIALIQFKRTMMSALYDCTSLPDLKVDDVVIVEGDRGEHIATVARVNVKKSKSTPTLIVRRATADDMAQHERVKEAEAVALETCRAHAQRLGLSEVMSVADVEYQLDFAKLTVFFAARDPSCFVDFRSLQRALYQHFRCRIWIADV
jgi:molybdopterin-guanine dinucleotide biosynthesis protein